MMIRMALLLPGVWMRVWWWVRVRVRVWVWVRVDEPDGVVAARRLDDTVEKGLGSGRSAG